MGNVCRCIFKRRTSYKRIQNDGPSSRANKQVMNSILDESDSSGGALVMIDGEIYVESYKGYCIPGTKTTPQTRYRMFSLSHPIIMTAYLMSFGNRIPLNFTLRELCNKYENLRSL